MLDKFWESLSENIAGEWLKYVFSPAFLFWAGGLTFYFSKRNWHIIWKIITGMQPFEQIVLIVIALVVLILSSIVMKNLRFTILRLLEGYWPWPFGKVASILSNLQNFWFESYEKQWNHLKSKEDSLNRIEHRKLSSLEMQTHYFPAQINDVQPTTLGNILRMAETTPRIKYGLDAVICWPRLWLLLPEDTRKEISAGREALMNNVELWAWGLLFLVWVNWSPWALVVVLLWLVFVDGWLQQSAMSYADLLDGTFDVHRWKLYEAVRWPLPEKSGLTEVEIGRRLTEFLWRGTSVTQVEYITEETKQNNDKNS